MARPLDPRASPALFHLRVAKLCPRRVLSEETFLLQCTRAPLAMADQRAGDAVGRGKVSARVRICLRRRGGVTAPLIVRQRRACLRLAGKGGAHTRAVRRGRVACRQAHEPHPWVIALRV